MGSFWKLISVLLVIIFCLQSCLTCPSICSCKWKGGKQTADCPGQGLTIIPADLDVGTQVIDISRNSFTEITSEAFRKKGLVNLQKIYISECGITGIASDAFSQLSNLVELDLSRNLLETVPSNALTECPNVRRLLLAHNPIMLIESGAFSSLSHLTYLGLSDCIIKHIEPGALDGINELGTIELNGNQLTTLSIDVFQSSSYLYGFNIHNNPWYCDCKLREIRIWMIENNIPLNIPPECAGPPHLKKYSWKNLTLEDFACFPTMLNVPKESKVTSGHNASMHCQVDAIPRASIVWEVDGKILKNFSNSPELKIKYNIDNDESESRQSSVLTIYNATESDAVIYSCVAENKAGISSINLTLTVICPSHLSSGWINTQITLLLVGVLFVIFLAAVIIFLLVYHPVSFPFSSKINRKNVFQHLSSKKQDVVEMNDVREDKEEKDLKATDKQPRHETGSSGYGSDQLTPDLVSKIADMNNGTSLSTSTISCNHLESDNPALLDGYGSTMDHWPHGKPPKPARYDGSSPVRSNVYSEIYLNPCYGKEDDMYNYALQSAGAHQMPDCAAGDRYIPQNDRVRTLRAGYDCCVADSNRNDSCTAPHDEAYKRYPLVVANASGHFTLPPKSRFSPDEGYAEEGLEGTEV